MKRVACVSLPEFPLQLLCRRHPDWRGVPVVVVVEDKPSAKIVWANEKARSCGVLPGQRYAQGLSLSSELRAGVIGRDEIEAGVALVVEALRRFSPDVEDCRDEPGVFWVGADGMHRLYASASKWARAIGHSIEALKLVTSVVVGYTRFGSYAVAKARPDVRDVRDVRWVFRSAEEERAEMRRVPLDRLGIPPGLRDYLAKLGVVTLGAFLRLPAGGLLERFGPQAFALHERATQPSWNPINPRLVEEPKDERIILDDPIQNSNQLVFIVKRATDAVLGRLASSHEALATLFIEWSLDRAPSRMDVIRPAEPTLDSRMLSRLVHLRLESAPLPSGVVEVMVSAEEVRATAEQLELFATTRTRDLRAANEALARLRAEFGNDAVVRAEVRDGHLPEARFHWKVIDKVELPVATERALRPVVRRVYGSPRPLPPQSRSVRDDGWLLAGTGHGPVTDIRGPYIVSGGWWVAEVHREYHYADVRDGSCLWVFYDRKRRRWYVHGAVE